jgi:hypothetical protein
MTEGPDQVSHRGDGSGEGVVAIQHELQFSRPGHSRQAHKRAKCLWPNTDSFLC